MPSFCVLAEPHLGVTSAVAGTSTSMLEILQVPCCPPAPATGSFKLPAIDLTEQQKLRSYPCASAVALHSCRHCSPPMAPPATTPNAVYVLSLRVTSHRALAALVKLPL